MLVPMQMFPYVFRVLCLCKFKNWEHFEKQACKRNNLFVGIVHKMRACKRLYFAKVIPKSSTTFVAEKIKWPIDTFAQLQFGRSQEVLPGLLIDRFHGSQGGPQSSSLTCAK